MSGALNTVHRNVSYALQLHAEAMARLQEQAYTGSRINRASDDPSNANRILGLNSQGSSLENYMDNISEIIDRMNYSLPLIDSMAEEIAKTKVSLTQIASGTYGDGETGQRTRERTADEINDRLEQMVASANTKHQGQYIFGGGNTNSAPYVVQRSNGEITSVTYQGSLQSRDIEVAPGVQSDAFYAGDSIFRSDDREAPVISGSTGAAAGTGTSNIKGNVWLTVTHDGSNYKLSIDDGTTEVTVPGAGDISNIAVTNATGEVLYVDATNIAATGVVMVRVPGTHDVFSTLIDIRDLLNNQRGLSGATVTGLMNDSVESLDEISNLLTTQQVTQGTKIGFLDTLRDSLETMKFGAEDETTLLQEADIAQIAIDISRRDVLYQMSLSVAAKLMSMSLLDFIG